METIKATPENVLQVLANTAGGFAVALVGEFNSLGLRQRYEKPISIFANLATIRGLTLEARNVDWYGGTIEASGGSNGFAKSGYGVLVNPLAENLAVYHAVIRNADRGVVVSGGLNVAFVGCDLSVRQDGFIVSGGRGMRLIGNRFHDFYPRPTVCTYADGTTKSSVARRDCVAAGGVWKDGDHSDAIQLRNAVTDATIAFNTIENVSQGIGQMDAVTDAPLKGIAIVENAVEVSGFHSITIGPTSTEISVIKNRTRQTTGRRSLLKLPAGALVLENLVQSP